jgi:hypothetical protein
MRRKPSSLTDEHWFALFTLRTDYTRHRINVIISDDLLREGYLEAVTAAPGYKLTAKAIVLLGAARDLPEPHSTTVTTWDMPA